MFLLLGIILLITYLVFMVFIFVKVIDDRLGFLLYYIVIFLPVYIVFLSTVYQATGSSLLIEMLRYSKEVLILYVFGYYILSKSNPIQQKWDLGTLDYLFLGFLTLSGLFVILPIGEAPLFSKAVYFKNILLFCLMYFFGRNFHLSFRQWNNVFLAVFLVALVAFCIGFLEQLTGTHFHSLIGYGEYRSNIENVSPQGSYGLSWTFEAQGGQKRFAAFYANPLEFAASILIPFSAAIIYLFSVPYNTNRAKYFMLAFLIFFSVVFAYSRASFVALFVMLFFMALMLRFYRLIFIGVLILFIFGGFIAFTAPQSIKYFVVDTIMFENTSSITHLIEWVEALNSIQQHPLGIGLATSGNAGGVEADLKVGGENQFLIFGVQLGIPGLLLYISMLFVGIRNCWKAYILSNSREEQIVPFVAASVKFGLLLPLFTANAESYLYVSFFSWWMIGHGTTTLRRLQYENGLK